MYRKVADNYLLFSVTLQYQGYQRNSYRLYADPFHVKVQIKNLEITLHRLGASIFYCLPQGSWTFG